MYFNAFLSQDMRKDYLETMQILTMILKSFKFWQTQAYTYVYILLLATSSEAG